MYRWFAGVVALLAAGCGAHRTACLAPAAAGPAGPGPATYDVSAADGVCLRGYTWRPEGPPRAAFVVVHGLRDHADRYGELADALTATGVLVVGQDHRGHGRSGGDPQRFDAIDQLTADVDLAVAHARQEAPGVPVFLFGHSLGGLVATAYALDHGTDLAGLVLSGAALALAPDVTPGKVRAVRTIAGIAPGAHVGPLDDTVFNRDPAAKAALAADPLVDHRKLPAASARAAVDAQEALDARMVDLGVPLLAMHGTADAATNPEGTKRLVERAASADKTLKLWDGLYHDLVHEPEHAEVVGTVVRWVEERLPAPVEQASAAP